MIVYTVHEPLAPSSNIEERAEEVVFVKEGFSAGAFFFTVLWLIFEGLWFEALATVLLASLAGWGLAALGFADQAPGMMWLFTALVLGFEGNNLKRWRLERKGYVLLGTVAGRGYEECERRFFDAWLPRVGGSASQSPRPASGGGWDGPGVIGTLPGATI